MSNRNFPEPVHVLVTEGAAMPVASLAEAFDFLADWPRERRGVIYETAHRACCAAHDGRLPVEAAQKAFAGFARSAGILASSPIVAPWMLKSGSSRGGVSA